MMDFQLLVSSEIIINAAIIFLCYVTFFYLRLRKPKIERPYRVCMPTVLILLLCIPAMMIALANIALAPWIIKGMGLGITLLSVVSYIAFNFLTVVRWFKSVFEKCRGKKKDPPVSPIAVGINYSGEGSDSIVTIQQQIASPETTEKQSLLSRNEPPYNSYSAIDSIDENIDSIIEHTSENRKDIINQ